MLIIMIVHVQFIVYRIIKYMYNVFKNIYYISKSNVRKTPEKSSKSGKISENIIFFRKSKNLRKSGYILHLDHIIVF